MGDGWLTGKKYWPAPYQTDRELGGWEKLKKVEINEK
jgi:hypothetical protein